ncbi:putative C-type lectin domain family 20 member A [Triplophysa dalaica]|uniref:putative C-type lectin domain family 20 member A n=1 Tax=Triplophysa dalaica TaxID=1582913 RepID=UPI0024DFFCEB|nr:putative C-type lectin domain family 20 member A [Triplophysa dalaica]
MLKHQRGAVRAVMDMSLFVLLLLSGLMCSASVLRRPYHYINQNMTWSAAQSYCRERFTDLATVDSMNDVNRMINAVNDGYSGSVWIGLKRGTQGRWGWSNGDGPLTQYSAWFPGQPSGDGACVICMCYYWYDRPCAVLHQFMCYDETLGNIMISSWKNWTDARSYCRLHHTDLATVSSPEKQSKLNSVVGCGPWVWIGLFSDSWQWSDHWSLSFRNWASGQQFQSFGDCVALSITDSGKWVQFSCDQKHPFICHGEDKFVKKQTVRLNLSNDGNHDLNDSSTQTAILNEISEKLQSMGLEDFKSISWRKDENGEVFHLSTYTAVNSNNTCDEYTEAELTLKSP